MEQGCRSRVQLDVRDEGVEVAGDEQERLDGRKLYVSASAKTPTNASVRGCGPCICMPGGLPMSSVFKWRARASINAVGYWKGSLSSKSVTGPNWRSWKATPSRKSSSPSAASKGVPNFTAIRLSR